MPHGSCNPCYMPCNPHVTLQGPPRITCHVTASCMNLTRNMLCNVSCNWCECRVHVKLNNGHSHRPLSQRGKMTAPAGVEPAWCPVHRKPTRLHIRYDRLASIPNGEPSPDLLVLPQVPRSIHGPKSGVTHQRVTSAEVHPATVCVVAVQITADCVH